MAMGNKGPNADVEDPDDEPPMPRPARSVTLEAVSTILRSIQDLDTPYARTVEEIMASFGRQTRVDSIRWHELEWIVHEQGVQYRVGQAQCGLSAMTEGYRIRGSRLYSHRTDRRDFFVKGYKIDQEKLQANFRRSEEDPEYVRFLYLWQKFPAPFLYLATGKEPGEKINLVVVLADGYDKAILDEVSVVELSEPYTTVFTKGIWVKDA
ncbi:hypothetical protein EDB89DRAFT_1908426 [Lactarius sanguifluus]|nr:hypothetical protein EDB89DRAFT_1908426 [Lactarius sanguifluus]